MTLLHGVSWLRGWIINLHYLYIRLVLTTLLVCSMQSVRGPSGGGVLVGVCELLPELLTLNSGTIYGLRVNNMKLDRWAPFFPVLLVTN